MTERLHAAGFRAFADGMLGSYADGVAWLSKRVPECRELSETDPGHGASATRSAALELLLLHTYAPPDDEPLPALRAEIFEAAVQNLAGLGDDDAYARPGLASVALGFSSGATAEEHAAAMYEEVVTLLGAEVSGDELAVPSESWSAWLVAAAALARGVGNMDHFAELVERYQGVLEPAHAEFIAQVLGRHPRFGPEVTHVFIGEMLDSLRDPALSTNPPHQWALCRVLAAESERERLGRWPTPEECIARILK